MSTATVEIDKDLARAGFIKQIQGESEIRNRQGAAQQRRQSLVEKLKATTQKLNEQIQECGDVYHMTDCALNVIDQAKGELLRSTPEGKQILALQAEINELKWVNQEPQVLQLKHKLEIALDRDEPEGAAILRGKIANLESKIEQRQTEIDALWSSFGFESDTLRRV